MCIYIDRYTYTCIWFVVSYTGRAHFKLSTIQTPTVPFFLSFFVQVTTPVRLALPGCVCFQCQGTSSGQAESNCKNGMSGLPTTTRSCHRSSRGRKKKRGHQNRIYYGCASQRLSRLLNAGKLNLKYICQGFYPFSRLSRVSSC